MATNAISERRARSIAELQDRCSNLNSEDVVDNLSVGLSQLRDLLLVRTHDDIERKYGADSMIGTSIANIERQNHEAKFEVEIYSCVVVNEEVSQQGYVDNSDEWFLDWLYHLRLNGRSPSNFKQRLDYYRSRSIEERRLKFVSVLQHILPESMKAPLVLHRLFPRSLRIVTAKAFGDIMRADELRKEQSSLLPAIADCHECHGRVLNNDEKCRCCGNPVWNLSWLLSD